MFRHQDEIGQVALNQERFVLVPKSTAHLLSIHYGNTSAEYYCEFDRATAGIFPFLMYAVEDLVDGLRVQLAIRREHHV